VLWYINLHDILVLIMTITFISQSSTDTCRYPYVPILEINAFRVATTMQGIHACCARMISCLFFSDDVVKAMLCTQYLLALVLASPDPGLMGVLHWEISSGYM